MRGSVLQRVEGWLRLYIIKEAPNGIFSQKGLQASQRQGHHPAHALSDQPPAHRGFHLRRPELLHRIHRGQARELPTGSQLQHVPVQRRHGQARRQDQPHLGQDARLRRGHHLRRQIRGLLLCGVQAQVLRGGEEVLHPDDQRNRQLQHDHQALLRRHPQLPHPQEEQLIVCILPTHIISQGQVGLDLVGLIDRLKHGSFQKFVEFWNVWRVEDHSALDRCAVEIGLLGGAGEDRVFRGAFSLRTAGFWEGLALFAAGLRAGEGAVWVVAAPLLAVGAYPGRLGRQQVQGVRLQDEEGGQQINEGLHFVIIQLMLSLFQNSPPQYRNTNSA